MADKAKRLRTFLEVSGGGRNPGATRTSQQIEPTENPRDLIGVNGASVNDIQNLVDLVPPPQSGLPEWASNKVLWNQAMKKVNVDSLADNEAAYEAVAFAYHAMGGELVTSDDMEEEIDMLLPENQQATQEISLPDLENEIQEELEEEEIDDEEDLEEEINGEIQQELDEIDGELETDEEIDNQS